MCRVYCAGPCGVVFYSVSLCSVVLCSLLPLVCTVVVSVVFCTVHYLISQRSRVTGDDSVHVNMWISFLSRFIAMLFHVSRILMPKCKCWDF